MSRENYILSSVAICKHKEGYKENCNIYLKGNKYYVEVFGQILPTSQYDNNPKMAIEFLSDFKLKVENL